MRYYSYYLVLLVLSYSSCTGDKPSVNPDIANGYIKDEIGIDSVERILLYNGPDADPFQGNLLLDGDVITFEDSTDQLNLGESYKAIWRNTEFRFFHTEFPIIKIQTRTDETIGDEYSSSQFSIIESGDISLTGNVGIRLRGNTSLSFPKKSYRLELWEDEQGEKNRKTSLLGMRDDDDWLLDGMWNEPLSIRDMSAMELWLGFGRVHYQDEEPNLQLGADREYCELFINGTYHGLYYIGERLDRKQLKLEVRTGHSNGGELYKAKGWGDAVGGFSLPEVDNSLLSWGNYWIKYPEEPGTYDWTKLRQFTAFYLNGTSNTFKQTYPDRIDVNNIIDYFILINILIAFDNAGNNVYIARKDQMSPYFFVSWDFDATLGLGIFGNESPPNSSGLVHHKLTNSLLLQPDAKILLKDRWNLLRSDYLRVENIKRIYRNNHSLLLRNKIYARESSIPRLERSLPDSSSMQYLEGILDQQLLYLDDYIESL